MKKQLSNANALQASLASTQAKPARGSVHEVDLQRLTKILVRWLRRKVKKIKKRRKQCSL